MRWEGPCNSHGWSWSVSSQLWNHQHPWQAWESGTNWLRIDDLHCVKCLFWVQLSSSCDLWFFWTRSIVLIQPGWDPSTTRSHGGQWLPICGPETQCTWDHLQRVDEVTSVLKFRTPSVFSGFAPSFCWICNTAWRGQRWREFHASNGCKHLAKIQVQGIFMCTSLIDVFNNI